MKVVIDKELKDYLELNCLDLTQLCSIFDFMFSKKHTKIKIIGTYYNVLILTVNGEMHTFTQEVNTHGTVDYILYDKYGNKAQGARNAREAQGRYVEID